MFSCSRAVLHTTHCAPVHRFLKASTPSAYFVGLLALEQSFLREGAKLYRFQLLFVAQTMWHSQGILTVEWGNGLGFYIQLSEYLAPGIIGCSINPCWHSNKSCVLRITWPALGAELNKASQTLLIMGDFDYPNICWRRNTVNHKQSRSFLGSIDNFPTQAVKDPTRNCVLLELILRGKTLL